MKRIMRSFLIVVFFSLALCAPASQHHEADVQKLGVVVFPTSCSPAVQKEFERGVALLHSFARAVGCARSGQLKAARESVGQLARLQSSSMPAETSYTNANFVEIQKREASATHGAPSPCL